MIEMDQYQERALGTSIFEGAVEIIIQDRTADEVRLQMYLLYCATKLTGEAGEVSEEIGKMLRDDFGVLTPEKKDALIKELGDVLWYTARIAKLLGVDLSYVAHVNLKKLAERKEQDKIHGKGSER